MKKKKSIKLILYGHIPSWKAPISDFKRAQKFNRAPRMFNREYKRIKELKILLQEQLSSNFEMFIGPIEIYMTHYREIPKSRQKSINPEDFCITGADTTNLNKLVEDCLQGIVFENDRTVACILGQKMYDHFPRTEIRIREL